MHRNCPECVAEMDYEDNVRTAEWRDEPTMAKNYMQEGMQYDIPQREDPQMNAPATLGEQLVGVKFNPSGNPNVDVVKYQVASIIDLLLNAQSPAAGTLKDDMVREAVMDLLKAQMMAVKVLTFDK